MPFNEFVSLMSVVGLSSSSRGRSETEQHFSHLTYCSVLKTENNKSSDLRIHILFNTLGSNANLKNKFDVIKISKRSNRTQWHS